MKDIKISILLHLILGPIGILIIVDDAAHPERWDTWYRNPAISIPYCIALDVVIWCLLLILLHREQRARRFQEGIRLMAEANRLRAQGRYREAEPIWQEGVRLTEP